MQIKGKKYRYDKETGKMVEIMPANVLPDPTYADGKPLIIPSISNLPSSGD